MAELVIITGSDEGRAYRLAEKCVIGRHADCDLPLKDDTVSRRHAALSREPDGYYVEDLGSSNGTFVNGQEIRRVRLAHGDTIKLSRAVLAFRDETPSSRTSVSLVAGDPGSSAVLAPEDAVASLMRDSACVEDVDQLQDLHHKLVTMARFSEALQSTLDLQTLLERVLALLFDVFPQGQRAFVMLYDDARVLQTAASRSSLPSAEITVSRAVIDAVVGRRQAILSNNPVDDTRFGAGQSIVSTGMMSLMAAPLIYSGEVLGVLHLDSTRASAPFSTDDLALFSGLAAAAVSAAVANARLHQSLLRRQRLEQELSIAQTVQKSFLPRRMPCDDRVEIACHYALACQVGGDFYDVLDLPDGRLALSIGDVSGKGIPAALLMAKTISEMRVAAAACSSPGAMLHMVNRLMLGTVSPEMFVTAAVCFFDTASGTVILGEAGHTPPVLRRAAGDVQLLELPKGFPLGVVPDGQYQDAPLALGPADTLLFYTDGLTDSANADAEAFGVRRLCQSVALAPPGARSVIDAVLADVADFAGLNRPFDDLTMIALSPKTPAG